MHEPEITAKNSGVNSGMVRPSLRAQATLQRNPSISRACFSGAMDVHTAGMVAVCMMEGTEPVIGDR
jgi:hypothetical protein